MPRMTYNQEAYHNALDEEVDELIKAGWRVISEKEFQEVLHNKRKTSLPTQPVTSKTQVKHVNSANNN